MEGKTRISGAAKIALGVILPISAFVVFDLLLLRSIAGKGEALGFAGMALFFRSFIVLPLLLVVNALLMCLNWKSKGTVLFAGFFSPTIAAVCEWLFLYGRH